MLEPGEKPRIFRAIDAEDHEEIERILEEEGIAAILTPYGGGTVIDYLFCRLDTADTDETFKHCITFACRLLEFYRWACVRGKVGQGQRLDLQHHLGRAIYHAISISDNKIFYSLILALLNAGGRINEILPDQPYTALGKAIIANDRSLVAYLLDNGADPEITNADHTSSIELAIRRRADKILWDMLIHLRLHRAHMALADIFARGFPDEVNAILAEGKLARQDILALVGVALWLGGPHTAFALMHHYLATAPNIQTARNELYSELLFGLVRSEDAYVFVKLAELGLFDATKVEELVPRLLSRENDVLMAALIGSPFYQITVIQSGPNVLLAYCPTFTLVCKRGMKRTAKAFLRAGFLTPDMVTHALEAAIKIGDHTLIRSILKRVPVSARLSLALLHQAVAYDHPFCLAELIIGGADLSLCFQSNLAGDMVITEDNYDDFLLSICCQPPEIGHEGQISRFACALILLEASSGPLDSLNRLCDFIFIDATEEEDMDVIRLLSRLGISPEELLWRFVTDYHDPLILAANKDLLSKAVIVACEGTVCYIDALLEVKSYGLICQGCMGLFRISGLPTPPLDIGLINIICEIADNPSNFPSEIVAAVEAVVKSIIAMFRRISENKTLFERSSDALMAVRNDEIEMRVDSYSNTFSQIFGETLWAEMLARRTNGPRQHYQLMALQLLIEVKEVSLYYKP